jgi:dipeptidyl aminopeptidase/acylaminoacyl peptidase
MGAARMSAVVLGAAIAIAVVGFASPSEATFPGDNGLIAYTRGNGDEERSRILTVRPDGTGTQVVLRSNARFDGGPAGPEWSRDGKRLLFAQYRRSDSRVRALWYADANGEHVTRIPLGLGQVVPYGYAWAPGGSRIVFAIWRESGPRIYTIRVDGTHRRYLARGQDPSWSIGGHVVFERQLDSPAPNDYPSLLFIMRADGSGLRRLTTGGADADPSFSPDGKKVAFTRNQGSLAGEQWRAVGISGRHDVLIAHHPATNRVYCPAQWTPDGARLGAVRTDDGPTDNDPSIASFVTVAPDGTDERSAFVFDIPYVARYSMCDFSWQPR